MNLKGCNLELAHRNSQVSIPFYLSDLGYGFLWNNAAIGEVHFGLNTTEWIAEVTPQMDYWITAGDTPAQIEEHYAQATGKAPMMPEYGLGFWQCKLRYYNQQQVIDVASEYYRRGIPLDAQWIAAGTGVSYEGGRCVEADAPIERISVFLREGRQSYLIGKV